MWMFGCAYAGYHKRFWLFVVIAVVGMTLNTVWMVFGLDARPLSPPAITAHMAAMMYALSAFGFGLARWTVNQQFSCSKVDEE